MKRITCLLAAWLGLAAVVSAQTSLWPDAPGKTIEQAAAEFVTPPGIYASHVIWGWEGKVDAEQIRHDLDAIQARGFRSIIIEAGYHLPYEYLSEGWFEMIRTGVLEAKARGMKVWIIDEGKYPSGFAGGKFTREKPEMRMKALVVKDTIRVESHAILTGREVAGDILSAVAVSRNGLPDRNVEIKDGKFDFYAGPGAWDILLVGAAYRTGQTRAVANENGVKDTRNSLCDYLSPQAVRQFIDWTHEQYQKYIGDEFGKTVLGFRGDEPDFSYLPWTPDMVAEFTARKGYDPTPYLGGLLGRNMTVEQKRFRADYWDVWSDLFAVNFFQQQADWCAENGLAHITHLNNDHNMPVCIRAEGNFFRDLSKVQVPGVDAIWNQIWPETVNDYPKFASSVSHVYGKPRAFSESFAAYNTPPSIPQAKYAVDYQMIRGINFFEFMFWMAGSDGRGWMSNPGMKELNDYTGRITYLMSLGKPGARIAVYYPTSTFWLNDTSVNPDLVETAELLLQHQRDFDWVDDDAFSEALDVHSGFFLNRSGQKYHTLIIPSCNAISEKAWAAISEFAERGGKVLFWGRKPTMLVGRQFMQPKPLPLLERNVYEEPGVVWTPAVEASLPEAEFSAVSISRELRFVHYTRRQLADGSDIYLIFNEGEKECNFEAVFDNSGVVMEWDGYTGARKSVDGAVREGARTRLNMTLQPWESRVISIERRNTVYNVRKFGVKTGLKKAQTAAIQALIDKAAAAGGGTLVFPAGKYLTGALFFPRGVNLRIEKNALIQGTANPDDYPQIPTRFEGYDRMWRCALLNFDDSPGVRVDGAGTVDGNGLEWNKVRGAGGGRPRMICFTGCDGGSISGLRLQNQASWCLHVLYTEGFDIDRMHIEAREYIPSSDGIDIDSSCDVRIANTYIYVHDDCISIKSGKDAEGRRVGRPSEDILIEDCHFAYGHGAVTMGSEISGGIRNVLSRNCVVDGDNWGVFRFKSQPSRGGVVQNITFENFTISDVRNIFDVSLEWKSSSERNKVIPYSDPVTQLKNVRLVNCSGSGRSMGTVHGFPVDPIRPDVFHFENCHFQAETGLRVANADLDFSGMEFEVSQGERIIKQ